MEEGWQAADLVNLMKAKDEGNRAVDIARSGEASPAVRQEAEAFREDAVARLGQAEKSHKLLEAVLDVSSPREPDGNSHAVAGPLMGLAQPSADEQYAAAFRRWGLDIDATAEAEVVARLSAEPNVVVQELIAGLDSWMLDRRRQKRPDADWRRLFRVADQLDRGEQHRQLRALLVEGAPPQARDVAALIGGGAPWPALWELARGGEWRQLQKVRTAIDPRTEPVLTVVLLARAFAAVGDAGEAKRVLRQASTTRPDQVVLLGTLAKLLDQQGPSQLTEAIGYYRQARSKRPNLGIALSNALYRNGQLAEAEEVMQELIHLQPANPACYFYHGIVLDELSNHGKAQIAFRKAIDRQPHYAEAYNNLGCALFMLGNISEAEAAIRKAIDLKPGFALAHRNLGCTLGRQQQSAAAEAAFRRAIELQPDVRASYRYLGKALEDQGKLGQAEAVFRKVIDLKLDLPDAYYSLGGFLIRRRQFSEAEAAFRQAIDLKPHFAAAYFNLGVALGEQRKADEAEAAYRQAIDLKPDFADAYFNLGNLLSVQYKHAKAEAAYRQAIELKPDFHPARINLANSLYGQRKFAEAETVYREAIARRPDIIEAHLGLALTLLDHQKLGDAEAAFRKAIDLKSNHALARYFLGLTLMRQDRFDEAAASMKKAGELLPAKHPYREPARQFQQQCQRYAILDARLPAVLRGTEKPCKPPNRSSSLGCAISRRLTAPPQTSFAKPSSRNRN